MGIIGYIIGHLGPFGVVKVDNDNIIYNNCSLFVASVWEVMSLIAWGVMLWAIEGTSHFQLIYFWDSPLVTTIYA